MIPDRRPSARMEARAAEFPAPVLESREPHSIRFTPSEWDAICNAARVRLLEPAVFVRALAMYALQIASGPSLHEAALGIPAQMLAGSQGMRRF